MLKTLKDLFDAIRPPSSADSARDEQHLLQLATAVLLVEVMRADSELGAAERRAVIAALRDKFALADDEIDRLMDLAEPAREARPALRLHLEDQRVVRDGAEAAHDRAHVARGVRRRHAERA